ncbi:MAG: S9 family peptidase, partial [Rikenellaceae bacterium]
TWSSDGKSVYFISNREGGSQLWQVDVNSGKLKKITSVEGGINGYQISPNQTSIWYTTQVKVDQTAKDKHSDMDKANAMIYDDLMARHWDYWLDGTYSHIFVAEFDGVSIQNATNIMEGEPWDAPLAPYFDSSEISWSNDGKLLAYACKKLTGLEYAESTNSDIYLYNMADKTTSNITEGMVGYDLYPLFSPDDKQLAWVSMERMSNESDKERLFVVDLESGKKSYLTKEFDYNASSLVWDSNSSLYFIAPMQATHQICKVEVKEGAEVEVLTEGLHDYNSILKYGDKLLATKTTLSMASEIFSVDPSSGDETQISYINKDIYDNVDMAKVEKRWVKTTDGKEMLVWVILPPNFDENKKYPTLLYCQGGPQSVVSQFWSYRWNFQLMAAQGYVVVAPNRRGLPSFGSEWLDQISGDYSGQNIKDYLSAIDAVSKEKWVDSDRRACVGASYGGYSTFFLAGNHEKRFKTFIAHCGMFNMESFYYGTEELWFPNNDLKGAPHSDDPIAKRSYANSPHKFVKNWDSPILIFSGLKDYRIPYSENLQAFTAARTMGLEARLVAFEDEGHQVFKPQNAMIWHREFYEWLDKYLK